MTNKPEKTKVWDAPVRLFHWCLAILIGLAWYSGEQDKFGIWADVHLWSGYGVIVLVSWRILWGFVGSETARFAQFVKGPAAILAYLRGKGQPYTGHNPLGALSVLILLLLPLTIAVFGLFSSDGMLFSGPFAGSNGEDIQDIHETLGEILYWIIGLHISAVLWYALVKKTNLLLPMITGKKRLEPGQKAPSMKPPMLAGSLALMVAAAGYFIIFGQ
jgi:cytochrome b